MVKLEMKFTSSKGVEIPLELFIDDDGESIECKALSLDEAGDLEDYAELFCLAAINDATGRLASFTGTLLSTKSTLAGIDSPKERDLFISKIMGRITGTPAEEWEGNFVEDEENSNETSR